MAFNTPRLGNNLRLLREERGLMSKEVAEAAGLKPSHYSEIENGRRPVTSAIMARLAVALGLMTDELREKLREMAGGNDAGSGDRMGGVSAVSEGREVVYRDTMISRAPDSAALAAHLLSGMPREDVFELLRELTKAGEEGDEVALRKARALLELIPTTHPTTAVAGG